MSILEILTYIVSCIIVIPVVKNMCMSLNEYLDGALSEERINITNLIVCLIVVISVLLMVITPYINVILTSIFFVITSDKPITIKNPFRRFFKHDKKTEAGED